MKPSHIKAHRRIWILLAVLLPIGFVAALFGKFAVPADAPAVRLQPAATQN